MTFGRIGASRTLRRLPYDAEVEYLESYYTGGNGVCFIDSGYIPKSNTVCEIDFMPMTDAGSGYNYVPIGGRVGFKDRNFNLFWPVNRATECHLCFGNSDYGYNVNFGSQILDKRWLVKWAAVGGDAWVNGTRYSIGTASASIVYQEPLRLWNLTINSLTRKMRIYSCKLWESELLVRDFVPVRFTNELGQPEGALYDRANPNVGMNPDGSARADGLYRNRGTGAFVVGPDA